MLKKTAILALLSAGALLGAACEKHHVSELSMIEEPAEHDEAAHSPSEARGTSAPGAAGEKAAAESSPVAAPKFFKQ